MCVKGLKKNITNNRLLDHSKVIEDTIRLQIYKYIYK